MSNSYTQFCVELKADTPEKKEFFRAEMAVIDAAVEADEAGEPGEYGTYCLIALDCDSAYLQDTDAMGGVDSAAVICQRYLAKFNPEGSQVLNWAHTCDKSIPDSFGGGALLITAKSIRSDSNDADLYRKYLARKRKTRTAK